MRAGGKGDVNMMYDSMPLYPMIGPERGNGACVRVPVFGGGREPGRLPDESQCRSVWIENPCRPGELAEVLLGVDDCGNLTVCVRREERRPCGCRPNRPPRPCLPPPPVCPPPRPRCDARRGRLYGSW